VDLDAELVLRTRIMSELAARLTETDGTITRAELDAFPLASGESQRLVDRSRGIWNPRSLHGTLSVVSNPAGPYDDRETEDGLFRYAYRAGSIAGDNTKLRRAMELSLPIILLRTIRPGLFLPVFPVYVVGDDAVREEFILALDEALRFIADPVHPTPAQRRYAGRVAWERLHQPEFRVRVLHAYATRCTVCALRRPELLDAAHIISDREIGGEPVIPNGLSMCKIHHAAYDRDLLGITPDYGVEINAELLREIDGPMLQHGLKEMHGRTISVPRRRADRPDPLRLSLRYEAFRQAS
jgi:putative restriction endonuclease